MSREAFYVLPDLDFGLDAVTQKFAWLGRSGSGKTYGCKRFVEQMLLTGAQVLIVDSVGVWAGLRQGAAGFSIPVLGGLYGDISLEPSAGELVAEAVVETGSSMVLDTSQMTDGLRAKFMAPLGRRLFELKKLSPGAMHIVLDEAQDYVPQNIQRGVDEMVLHEWVRNTKQGRAFGMGLSFVSQRPQEINKKALNQVECVLAFQLTGAHERKALEYWLSDKGVDSKLSRELPSLEIGTPYVWSPQWLKVAKVCGRVRPIQSVDTSQTPQLGDAPRVRHSMRAIDLPALQKSMAAMVERVKDSDPIRLRAHIKTLEAQLQKAGGVDREQILKISSLLGQRDTHLNAMLHEAVGCVMEVEEALRKLHVALDAAKPAPDAMASEMRQLAAATPVPSRPAASAPSAAAEVTLPIGETREAPRSARPKPVLDVPLTGDLPPGEAESLKVIYSYGETGASVQVIQLSTGYAARSVQNYVQRLVTRRLIERVGGRLVITDAGVKLIPRGLPKRPRGKKLVQYLIDTLPDGESKLFALVHAAHPAPTPVSELHEKTGYAERSVQNYLQRLVTRRAISRAGRGQVVVHPEVFA